MTSTSITISAFARRADLSRARIQQLIADGLPVEEDGRIDPERAEAWIAENVDEERSARRKEAPAAYKGAADARADRARTDAERARLALQRERAALIDRTETERTIFARARAERDAWLAWPLRVAPLMAGELGIAEEALRPLLVRYVREHLQTLAETPIDQILAK